MTQSQSEESKGCEHTIIKCPRCVDYSNSEWQFKNLLGAIEMRAQQVFDAKFFGSPKPPPYDVWKASFMGELSRRIMTRANKIDDDWRHFTRD